MSITPKNWNTFQHYKDRSPAWIKLHRGLLHDYAFSRLPVASRALAPMLWLLASEYEDGVITGDFEEAAYKLHMTKNEFCEAINPLIEGGFFTLDSVSLAARKQPASLEKRREETYREEEEKNNSLRSLDDWPDDFREVFWKSYPRKSGKQAAIRELEKVRKRAIPWRKLMAAVAVYAATADPKYTKHPKTWLTSGCWDDEPDMRKAHAKPTVSEAIRAHIEGGISFGPKPQLIPSAAGGNLTRLLPQGGRPEPGDVHGSGGRDLVRIYTGSNPACDGPEDGAGPENKLVADRRRG